MHHKYQQGITHLLLLILIAAIVIVVFLGFQGKLKLPSISLFQKQPKVELKTEYQNPFKKETQFVNPFETYKNPFVINR